MLSLLYTIVMCIDDLPDMHALGPVALRHAYQVKLPYTAKHLRGKIFTVGIENDHSQENVYCLS